MSAAIFTAAGLVDQEKLIKAVIAANRRDVAAYAHYLDVALSDPTPSKGFDQQDVATMCNIMTVAKQVTESITAYYVLVLSTVEQGLGPTERHTTAFFDAAQHFATATRFFDSLLAAPPRRRGSAARRAAFRSIVQCVADTQRRIEISHCHMYVMALNLALRRPFCEWVPYTIGSVENDPFE